MLEAFKAHINREFPGLASRKLLLACSGGADSVVLVHLCEAAGLDYSVAHCNFRLRGSESDADEEFVASLSKSFGRPFYLTHFDTLGYVNKYGTSVQMAARELRYSWFSEILAKNDIDMLFTAHHADDSMETFLINLSRGTGLAGLTGIPAKGNAIGRPLLPFSRNQILAYARSENLQWREDSSNEDTKYLRNKIRLELIPLLKELHPTFLNNFLTTQSHLSGSAVLLQEYRQLLKKQWFEDVGTAIRIPVKPIAALNPLHDYLHMLFADYGFKDGEMVAALLFAGSGKVLYSNTHRLIRDRDHLLLQELKTGDKGTYDIVLETGRTLTPIILDIRQVPEMQEQSRRILYVDKETLNPVLTLRKWQKGDYFYPLGMKGKKKVSKFFKDEKLDMIAKEKQWLLCSGNDIVWVVGMRADERFKVTDTTNTIMKINWES
jgi:tRNA(Ile)-lysidine synthase